MGHQNLSAKKGMVTGCLHGVLLSLCFLAQGLVSIHAQSSQISSLREFVNDQFTAKEYELIVDTLRGLEFDSLEVEDQLFFHHSIAQAMLQRKEHDSLFIKHQEAILRILREDYVNDSMAIHHYQMVGNRFHGMLLRERTVEIFKFILRELKLKSIEIPEIILGSLKYIISYEQTHGALDSSKYYLQYLISYTEENYDTLSVPYVEMVGIRALTLLHEENIEGAYALVKENFPRIDKVYEAQDLNKATRYQEAARIAKSAGDISLASAAYELALQQIETNQNHDITTWFNYAIGLDNYGLFNLEIGNVKRALEITRKANRIFTSNLPMNHPSVTISQMNLALILLRNDSLAKSKAIFEHILETIGEVRNKHMLAVLYDNYSLCLEKNDVDRAIEFSQKAADIFQSNRGVNSLSYGKSIFKLGKYYWRNEDSAEKADSLFDRSFEILHQSYTAGSNLHYVNSYPFLDYFVLQDLSKAVALAKDLTISLIRNLMISFSFLDENEKLEVLNRRDDLIGSLASMLVDSEDQELLHILNDLALFTRSLTLRTDLSVLMTSMGRESNAEMRYDSLKRLMTRAMTMTSEQLSRVGIDYDLIVAEIALMQKEMGTAYLSDIMALYNKDRDTKYMKSKLDAGQSILNFVKTKSRNFRKNQWEDDISYAGILINEGSKQDVFFHIEFDSTEYQVISDLLNNMSRSGAADDLNLLLRKKCFDPIRPHLQEISELFISTDGIFNKVPFSLIRFESDEEYLFEYINLRLVGDFSMFGEPSSSFSNKSIALFGDPDFDLMQDDNIPVEDQLNISRVMRGQYTSRYFEALPGTRREVNRIEETLSEWHTSKFLGSKASELNFRSMGAARRYGIIHIATHGYFFEQPKSESKAYDLRSAVILSSSPMVRSGLVFSGINNFWVGPSEVDANQDGLVTSLEISNLALEDTELAVLSACETGLGDHRQGEGVYGLQRAFKMAGVDKLIMSLWKIPDHETGILMAYFYQHVVQDLDIYSAFREAQREMANEYPPFYWAGFVLVE